MCLALILGISIDMTIPLYYKDIFDLFASGLSRSRAGDMMFGILGQIALLHLFAFLLWRICELSINFFQTSIYKNMYDECFSYLNLHSYRFFSDHFSGSLVRRVGRLVRAFESLMSHAYWEILNITVRLVFTLVVLFSYHIVLGSLVLIWMVIFCLVNIFFARWKYPLDLAVNTVDSLIAANLSDVITNSTNVKLFTAHEDERVRFQKNTSHWYQTSFHSHNVGILINMIQAVLLFTLELAIVGATIYFWQKGVVSPGFLIVVQIYIFGLINRLFELRRIIQDIFTSFADSEEMIEILNAPHEIKDHPFASELIVREGKIDFINVSFGYLGEKKVLKDFNLSIHPREKIALVGHSGEGKTTVTKLLLRLFDISFGEILVDGQNISSVTLESLRRNISLVPQDPILFHRSLFENIHYGRRDASEEEVVEASKLANSHEFISQLKDGYQTLVGERGIKLSGGERQRVAIARAILSQSPLIILDEATSSLDSYSEKLIKQALHRLLEKKTAVIIAHRLSTIMECDRIIVMEGGKIVEMGKHADLLGMENGIYKHLWEIQAGGFIFS